MTITEKAIMDGTVEWTVKRLATAEELETRMSVEGGFAPNGFCVLNKKNDAMSQIISANDYTNGGHLALYGKDISDSNAGGFKLCAAAGEDPGIKRLEGYPSGALIWNYFDLGGSSIVAKSLDTNGYISYASGLKIQWGVTQINNIGTVSFPITFTSGNYTVSAIANASTPTALAVADIGFDSCKLLASGTVNAHWLAIGY